MRSHFPRNRAHVTRALATFLTVLGLLTTGTLSRAEHEFGGPYTGG